MMLGVLMPLILIIGPADAAFDVSFDVLSTLFLPYTYVPTAEYALGKNAAEQLAYDVDGQLLYSVGATNIHVIDFADVNNMRVLFKTSFASVDVTDVEVCDNHVFVSFDNQTRREDGYINVYRLYNRQTGSLDLVHTIRVGVIPDMIQPLSHCRTLLVSIEAEPYDDDETGTLVDNPGGVGILKFPDGPEGTYTLNVLNFDEFNARYTSDLKPEGVRHINANTVFSNDVEPEFISLNSDESIAYIGLQKNNAIAIVDLGTETIVDIKGLGFKNWDCYSMDASDKDHGRPKVSTAMGLNASTNKYDELYAFGARSFSFRRADTMELVYDSGVEIARKTAQLAPKLFNTDYGSANTVAQTYDQRSDDKGPETESIAVGHFGDITLLMIGNERSGTIAVYSIDERLAAIAPKFETLIHGVTRLNDTWNNLYAARAVSMLDPEDVSVNPTVRFVPAEKSPNGSPLLIASGSISGTITVLKVNVRDDSRAQSSSRT